MGEFGDWGSLGPASTAISRVWLRDPETHLVGRGDQTPQDGRREVWGTCEGDLQGVLSVVLGEQVLPRFAHGCLARLPVRAVQYKDAVEVVDLVLQDPGKQVGGFYLQRLARDVLARDGYGCRAFDVDLDPRYGEASFGGSLGRFRPICENGVDDCVLVVFDGGDEHPLEASDLGGCQANPLVVAHSVKHVLGEADQRLVESLDRRGAGLEHGVSELPDI